MMISILLACSSSLRMVAATIPGERKAFVNVSTVKLASLSRGMTEKEVEGSVGYRGIHEFTAALSKEKVRCVAYYRNDTYGKYYLVFINDRLSMICKPPPFEMRRVKYKNSWLNEGVLTHPESRLARVLKSQDMIGSRLKEELTTKSHAKAKQSVDVGLTVAYLLTRGLLCDPIQESIREKTYRTLLKRFDPFKICLGKTKEDAEARLGKAKIVDPLRGDREIRYYGSVKYGQSGCRELMWLALVYENNRVVRVFSDDFVDYSRIRKLERLPRK